MARNPPPNKFPEVVFVRAPAGTRAAITRAAARVRISEAEWLRETVLSRLKLEGKTDDP